MSIPNLYLLSTAALPAPLIAEAAARGIQLDTLSLIRTEAVEKSRELPERPITAVFTSRNAVDVIGKEGRPDWTLFCIGHATRRQAIGYFGEKAIAGTAASAAELAEEIIRGAAGKEVFFFCGDQRRDELPDRLRAAGFTVREVVVYRTIQTPQKAERPYEGIAFFSPSAVESFFSVNSVGAGTILFAIGLTTAAAILERTGRQAVVSGMPDRNALIHQMIAHFTL
jgi:uroporphyrinogen-III synthase